MNKRQLINALAVVLTAGATFTGNAVAADTIGAKTRTQVIAELEQARADGSFYAAGDGTPRGLARARFAAQEERERRGRADPATPRAAEKAAATHQRPGS